MQHLVDKGDTNFKMSILVVILEEGILKHDLSALVTGDRLFCMFIIVSVQLVSDLL